MILLRDSAWSVVFIVILALFGWVPYLAHWIIALRRTPSAFREGLHEDSGESSHLRR